MELQLITNGLLVTEAHRRQFKALDPQTVCVSLDRATNALYDLHGRLKIMVMDDFGYFPMTPKEIWNDPQR